VREEEEVDDKQKDRSKEGRKEGMEEERNVCDDPFHCLFAVVVFKIFVLLACLLAPS
jgi:hypothetical protein